MRFSSSICCIVFLLIITLSVLHQPLLVKASPNIFNLTLPRQHPNPEAVVQELQRKVANASAAAAYRSRALLEGAAPADSCLTGNPIDDCWRCDPDWALNPQKLADCGVGFGAYALGGKGGEMYFVTDSSDLDAVNPKPGTLRYAVIQDEPLWIVFTADMMIQLRHELIFNSRKTVDGRGYNVHITGNGCLTLQGVSNIIIHNVHIHDCRPSGNTDIRSSPTQAGHRGRSDGDGISISGSHSIWIDHCSLWQCTDGLIDAILGSTAITISNSYFTRHNEVMLLGHDDSYSPDGGMQVTIAFNHFGKELVQRMPRCRHGFIHIANNDFTQWKMYAIGGSASPTIYSQNNRYTAPFDTNAKEVTRRVDTDERVWSEWNWRTEGDMMVNGAFFVPSGVSVEAGAAEASAVYGHAYSFPPKPIALIDQLTMNSGVFGEPSRGMPVRTNPGPGTGPPIYDGTIYYLSAAARRGTSTRVATATLLLPLVVTVLQLLTARHDETLHLDSVLLILSRLNSSVRFGRVKIVDQIVSNQSQKLRPD